MDMDTRVAELQQLLEGEYILPHGEDRAYQLGRMHQSNTQGRKEQAAYMRGQYDSEKGAPQSVTTFTRNNERGFPDNELRKTKEDEDPRVNELSGLISQLTEGIQPMNKGWQNILRKDDYFPEEAIRGAYQGKDKSGTNFHALPAVGNRLVGIADLRYDNSKDAQHTVDLLRGLEGFHNAQTIPYEDGSEQHAVVWGHPDHIKRLPKLFAEKNHKELGRLFGYKPEAVSSYDPMTQESISSEEELAGCVALLETEQALQEAVKPDLGQLVDWVWMNRSLSIAELFEAQDERDLQETGHEHRIPGQPYQISGQWWVIPTKGAHRIPFHPGDAVDSPELLAGLMNANGTPMTRQDALNMTRDTPTEFLTKAAGAKSVPDTEYEYVKYKKEDGSTGYKKVAKTPKRQFYDIPTGTVKDIHLPVVVHSTIKVKDAEGKEHETSIPDFTNNVNAQTAEIWKNDKGDYTTRGKTKEEHEAEIKATAKMVANELKAEAEKEGMRGPTGPLGAMTDVWGFVSSMITFAYSKGEQWNVELQKQRGLPPDEAKRVAHSLATLDYLIGMGIGATTVFTLGPTMGLSAVIGAPATYIPWATTAYLAFSPLTVAATQPGGIGEKIKAGILAPGWVAKAAFNVVADTASQFGVKGVTAAPRVAQAAQRAHQVATQKVITNQPIARGPYAQSAFNSGAGRGRPPVPAKKFSDPTSEESKKVASDLGIDQDKWERMSVDERKAIKHKADKAKYKKTENAAKALLRKQAKKNVQASVEFTDPRVEGLHWLIEAVETEQRGSNLSPEDVDAVIEAQQAHDMDDWYTVLLISGYGITHDMGQAIEAADASYEQMPDGPPEQETAEDVRVTELAGYVALLECVTSLDPPNTNESSLSELISQLQ